MVTAASTSLDAVRAGPVVLVCTRGLSAFGSAMTAFAIDVWIYRKTGSYTAFAWLAILNFVPNLVVAPFAGALVDRVDKKSLLAACEMVCAVVLAGLIGAYHRESLDVAVAGAVVFTLAAVAQVRWIAMSVAISALVDPPRRPAINGLQQALQGFTEATAPLVGAGALLALDFDGVLAMDIASCISGLAGLATVRGRWLAPIAPGSTDAIAAMPRKPSFGREAMAGFVWIRGQPEMRMLLLFIMGYNFAGSIFTTTFTPFLLGILPPQGLAIALCLDGVAALLVGVALARWGRRFPPRDLVYAAAAGFGALLVVWGLARAPWLLWALAFVAGLLTSTIVASLQTVWQDAAPLEIQGRVFAARRLVSFLLVPLAVLASIPAARSLGASSIASSHGVTGLWGSGPAFSLGLMLSALGLALLAGCLWCWPRRVCAATPGAAGAP